MSHESKLQALKVLMQEHAPVRAKQQFGVLPGADAIPLQAGNLIEVLGEGQMTFTANLLKERPKARAAWMMATPMEVCPMALAQQKIALSQLLFLENVKEAQGMDILLTLLKSQLFEVVVFEQVFLPRRNLDAQIRKLTLMAEESGAVLLLLSKTRTSSYGVNIRVETEDAEGVQLQKVKGGG
jgi:hypothetical protein